MINWKDLPLGSEKYQAYICSEEWGQKRAAVRQRAKGMCEYEGGCGGKGTHTHHLTYKRIYEERLDDLQLLCKYHHDVVHGRVVPIGGKEMVKTIEQFKEEAERLGIDTSSVDAIQQEIDKAVLMTSSGYTVGKVAKRGGGNNKKPRLSINADDDGREWFLVRNGAKLFEEMGWKKGDQLMVLGRVEDNSFNVFKVPQNTSETNAIGEQHGVLLFRMPVDRWSFNLSRLEQPKPIAIDYTTDGSFLNFKIPSVFLKVVKLKAGGEV